jgi:hypothetical protein
MTDQSPQTGPASSPAGPSRGTGSGGSWAIFLGAAVVLLLMVALLFVGLSSSLRKSRELESARTELDQRAEALLKMRQDLTLQTQRVTETTGEINRLTTSLSAEREARTRDAKELTDLRAQRANLDRLRAEREKAAEDLRLATAERDELRRQAAEIAVVKSKLEEQVSALTLRLDEAMRSIRLLEERVAALTVERDELREQLRVARERVALVEAQLASGQLVPTQLVPGQAGTRPAAALSNNGLASSGPMTASGRLETLAGGRWSGLAGAGGASMIGAASSPSTSTAQPNQGGRIRLSGLFDPPPRPAASPQDQPAQPQGDLPAGVRMIEDSHATPPTGEGGNAPPSASPAANEPSSGPSAARWHGSGRATDADRSQGRQAPSGVFALTVTAQDEQVLRSASGIPEAMNDLPPSVRVVAANDHSAGWSQSPTPPATRPAIPTPTPTLTAPSEPSLTVQPTQQPHALPARRPQRDRRAHEPGHGQPRGPPGPS